MNRFRCTLLKLLAALLLGNLLFGAQAQAAGVTIITHGLNGDVDDWVNGMAEQIKTHYRFQGTNYSCYKVYFPSDSTSGLSWMRVRGARPSATDSGEIVIMLDWGQLADGYSFDTYEVAPAVVNALFQTNFISELGGHALAELPIHLIGHSRGGSLMSMISEILGVNGVWVDQLTTLDPHPLNNDGFIDIIYTAEDAPCRTYENVLFHDNYYQTISGLIRGEPVSGAYIRELTYLDGGYSGVGGAHSDVHLWYHGTVDARVPASDYAANITSAERQTWWTSVENTGRNAGFYYSRIGRGNRASTTRPVSSGAQIRDGLNQRWDFGAGSVNNRSSLATNNGKWPSLIKFNLTGTNLVAFGESSNIKLFYQWAQPASSNATVTFYLDDDLNPLQRKRTVYSTNQTNWNRTSRLLLQQSGCRPSTAQMRTRVINTSAPRCMVAAELAIFMLPNF